jgi:hypothetical protein
LAAAIASASNWVAERTKIALAVANSASKTARLVPSMFLISKSGPSAETVAGESSSAIRTIGFGKGVSSKRWGLGIYASAVKRCHQS